MKNKEEKQDEKKNKNKLTQMEIKRNSISYISSVFILIFSFNSVIACRCLKHALIPERIEIMRRQI